MPVLVLLLMSVFNLTILVSDRIVAGNAARQGARLAAELGNGQTGAALSTTQVDQQIMQSVLTSAGSLNFATILEVDIYHPSTSDGSYLSSDPHDSYTGTGAVITQGYPASNRSVSPPAEDSIGVRLLWQYTPPTGIYSFTAQLGEYAVMKAAPVLQ
jgi:Flp pilus assembly protein TadG